MTPTPEQVQSWAREASATGDGQELSGDALLRFAALACAWQREQCDWAEDCAKVLFELRDTLAERGARPATPDKAALWDKAWRMYERMLAWVNPP